MEILYLLYSLVMAFERLVRCTYCARYL